MDSILTSIKKILGIEESYDHFDDELIVHINSVFMTLQQLGVGPSEGYTISDSYGLWSDFLPAGQQLEAVKTYMGLKVRLVFDTPPSAAALQAAERQIAEWEWRLNVAVDPAPTKPAITV